MTEKKHNKQTHKVILAIKYHYKFSQHLIGAGLFSSAVLLDHILVLKENYPEKYLVCFPQLFLFERIFGIFVFKENCPKIFCTVGIIFVFQHFDLFPMRVKIG